MIEKIAKRSHRTKPTAPDRPDAETTENPEEAGNRQEKPDRPDFPRVLLWCNYDPYNAATTCDHINAIATHSRFDIIVLSRIGSIPDDIDLEHFDAVVIHYTLAVALDSYISTKTRYRLAAYRGLKALFIQDEYRFVERTREAIRRLGISLVFTCVPPNEIVKVYPPAALPGVTFVNVLTGYAPAWLTAYKAIPLRERTIDVGYRGRDYPSWHGRAGREKIEIGKRFLKDAPQYGLRCDIRWRERDRLYGAAWRRFLQNCRATLAVESGASVFDFEGFIGPRVETMEKLLGKRAEYESMRERFFVGLEDKIDLSQISPRVFEAAALRTLLIMYEGGYSGVVTPWVHYLPLKKDHSNMPEIVKALRDDVRVAEIIANAFSEVAMNDQWSFPTFVAFFDDHIGRHMRFDPKRPLRQDDIDKMRGAYPFFRVDNPHDLEASRSRRLFRRAIARLGARGLIDRMFRWRL